MGRPKNCVSWNNGLTANRRSRVVWYGISLVQSPKSSGMGTVTNLANRVHIFGIIAVFSISSLQLHQSLQNLSVYNESNWRFYFMILETKRRKNNKSQDCPQEDHHLTEEKHPFLQLRSLREAYYLLDWGSDEPIFRHCKSGRIHSSAKALVCTSS